MSPHIASVSGLRLLALMAPLPLLSACTTTPLDVVYNVDVSAVADAGSDADVDAAAGGAASSGGAGGSSALDPTHCYVLRSRLNGLCLGQGAPTSVFNNPGFLLDFAADCRDPAHSWQLAATPLPNVFTFHNQQSPYFFVLDVQMAAIRDGTPVITFGENGYDNQHFEVRPRDAFASELRPQHHPQSCVGMAAAGGSAAQITVCDPTDSTQAWLLQRSDCL